MMVVKNNKNKIFSILGLVFFLILSTGCSNKEEITAPKEYVEDIETENTVIWQGRLYHKVRIGNQTWIRENLDVGKWISSKQTQSNNGIIEKYYYEDDSLNYAYLGAYYQWNEAMNYDSTEGTRGICPPGWHIPTKAEFETLIKHVNSEGNALKKLGVGDYGGIGNNLTGFSAELSGWYNIYYYGGLGGTGQFWSSTQ